jgi:hypothetical protein
MPEHIRALVVVVVLGMGVFVAARSAAIQLVPEITFKRWRNLWLLSTLALFLSHNIWLCMMLMASLLLVYSRKESHVMGLYLVLLFVAPPAPATIPGFGIIDHFWTLDHYRLLALTLLLPAALSLAQRGTTLRLGGSPVDRMVLGYLILESLLAFRETSVTGGLRAVLSLWVDIFLPYYVASRSIRSMEGFRHALTGYVLAAMALSLIAIFEVLRSWRLYQAVLGALGFEGLYSHYLMRSGFLRPNASVGNSIVVGYVLVVALGFFLYLKELLAKPLHGWLGLAVLGLGIVASLSRGPWVGAAFLVVVFAVLGPRPVGRLFKLMFLGSVSLLVLSQLPYGQLLIDLLPVFGAQEQGNVEYRADLLTNALPVIERNFLFGSKNYLEAPELQVMMQGEGIIDVVNSFVAVVLASGMVGLLLFVGAFACAFLQLRQGIRMARRAETVSTNAVLGRALWATLAAVMLIIYTLSSITAVPTVYWTVIGLCVAYLCAIREENNRLEEGRREPSNA